MGRGRVQSRFAVVMIALGAAACANSSHSPSPPTSPPGSCSFFWTVPEGNGAYDWYEVDVAGAAWKSGQTGFGATAVGFYVIGYDPTMLTFETAGMTTAGEITLTTDGADTGNPVTFADKGGKDFYDATGIFTGSSPTLGLRVAGGGAGQFSGVLSDPRSSAKADGRGSIAIQYEDGANGVFGGSDAGAEQYAVCYPP